MNRLVFGLMAAVLAFGASRADEFETLFQKGNRYYEEGKYEAAIQSYEEIVRAGRGNWQVFYNLGNAYFRQNQLGKAILNYERALKLNPDNEDIRFNLEYANLKIVDRIPEPPKQAFVRWVETLFWKPSFGFLLWMTLGFYTAGMLLLSSRYYWPRLQSRRALKAATYLSWTLFLIFAVMFLLQWYHIETRTYAIVMQKEVRVTSSPTEDAVEVFSLHEGTKVQLQELSGKWVRIRLRDGKNGWLPLDSIEKI